MTPYAPKDNGMVGRFIRSFKEECVWSNNFKSIGQARKESEPWIEWYNNDRPHQALAYKTPAQVRDEFKKLAA